MGSFLSPDVLIMLIIGLFLDILGLLCLLLDWMGVGEVLSFVVDIIGMILFGFWTLMRSGQLGGKAAQVLKKILKRFIAPSAVELVPVLGDVAFSWTLTVILEVRNQ